MPEGANARAGRVRDQRPEAQHAALVIIEPHAFGAGLGMERAVHGDELGADDRLARQTAQIIEIIRRKPRRRPFGGAFCGAAEIPGRDQAADCKIVIAGDAFDIFAADARQAFRRAGVVTDDIAETDDAIDRLRCDVEERRFERLEIGAP